MGKKELTPERYEMAKRVRVIRKSVGLTQEKMSEILEISLSAYKKIESGENQISLEGLRKLQSELKISADYVLFGKHKDLDNIWEMVLNCDEYDKLRMLMRLINYFTKARNERYADEEEQTGYSDKIMNELREMDL